MIQMVFFILTLLTSLCFAEKVIWKGDVNANGSPTSFVALDTQKTYKIKASGVIDLGKWAQQGSTLGVDSCYQYNSKVRPSYYGTLKNSLDISVCNGQYRDTHQYESASFKPKEGGIHFWVHDLDYSDNSGSFQVEVIEVID